MKTDRRSTVRETAFKQQDKVAGRERNAERERRDA